jgi:hypothetical protein
MFTLWYEGCTHKYHQLEAEVEETHLSAPKMSLALSLLKSANPVIGKYSLIRDLSNYKSNNAIKRFHGTQFFSQQ